MESTVTTVTYNPVYDLNHFDIDPLCEGGCLSWQMSHTASELKSLELSVQSWLRKWWEKVQWGHPVGV